MKPSILVPVDFTDNAFNAYLYANNLAYYLECNLHLVHVVSGSFDLREGLEIRAGEGRLDVVESKLESFSRWHPNAVEKKFFPVETTVEVLQGNKVNEIVRRADRESFRFIVCGTRDKHTLKDKWLGTVSSGVANQANVPVILVPGHANFANLDTIVVGCDEHTNDDYVLAQIAVLSDWFESNVHFVHVQQNPDDNFQLVERDILDALVTLQKRPLKVEMATIEGADVVDALFSYSSEKMADLLVMISEKRNFLEQLLFSSMTRKAAFDTHVPTMIMHL